MVTLQSVQSHTGLTHHFYFLTFGHSGAQDWAPECPNIKKIKMVGNHLAPLGLKGLMCEIVRKIECEVCKSIQLSGFPNPYQRLCASGPGSRLCSRLPCRRPSYLICPFLCPTALLPAPSCHLHEKFLDPSMFSSCWCCVILAVDISNCDMWLFLFFLIYVYFFQCSAPLLAITHRTRNAR